MARTKRWVIDEKTFPKKGTIEEQLAFLIRYGILAPNNQNTQPWKFKIRGNKITILPDLTKKLKVLDKTGREMWISLGAALENILIAGEHFGLIGKEKIDAEKIVITFKETKSKKNPLFEFITKRVTNKRKAKRLLIKKKETNKLKILPFQKETYAFLLKDKKDLKEIAKLVDKGNEIIYSNPKIREEMISWARFNRYQVNKTNDGIPYKTMGIPPVSTRIGKIFMSYFLSPSFIKKSDQQKIQNSSGIIIITSKRDCTGCWVNTGRTLERILLMITSFGMHYSFINQPCQVKNLRTKLRKITKDWPQIIIRIGYARNASHTNRKPTEEVLI